MTGKRYGARPGAHRLAGTARLSLLAVATVACTGPGTRSTSARSRVEVTARTFVAAWQTADTAALVDLFSPQAVYDDFANQMQYRGLEEIVGYVTSAHAWADGMTIDVGAVHAADSWATVEWLMSGVQDRPIPGQISVATHREFVINGVTILELQGDRILRAADYVDVLPLLLQLGSTVELPDGGTMSLQDIGG